jgi:predicted choloylglycine hydrolase
MAIQISFQTLIEDQPGEQWRALFNRLWPGYRSWYLRSGSIARPGYVECRRELRKHMPELVPTWERLLQLVGGGDVESRFLSLWCPPPYITGCSQAVWADPAGLAAPALIRNYDFAPGLVEGAWLATRWNGQRVVAMGDCIWGALDGMNEAGLAVSLSFGGRTVSGDGFGIPLVVRYLLEVANTTAQAVKLLERLPVSMCYTLTLLDRSGDWATVFVSPDRTTEVTRRNAVTNFQHEVEWPKHALATNAEARLGCLQQQVDSQGTLQQAVDTLLLPPMYQSAYLRGYGTLYSAVYRPQHAGVELFWPGQSWAQSIDGFTAGERTVVFSPLSHGSEEPLGDAQPA